MYVYEGRAPLPGYPIDSAAISDGRDDDSYELTCATSLTRFICYVPGTDMGLTLSSEAHPSIKMHLHTYHRFPLRGTVTGQYVSCNFSEQLSHLVTLSNVGSLCKKPRILVLCSQTHADKVHTGGESSRWRNVRHYENSTSLHVCIAFR